MDHRAVVWRYSLPKITIITFLSLVLCVFIFLTLRSFLQPIWMKKIIAAFKIRVSNNPKRLLSLLFTLVYLSNYAYLYNWARSNKIHS